MSVDGESSSSVKHGAHVAEPSSLTDESAAHATTVAATSGSTHHDRPKPRRSYTLARKFTGETGSKDGRNLVLCFDGTGNTYGEQISSMPLLYSFLSADPKRQLCFYQPGIGTYSPGNLSSPAGLFRAVDRASDLAFATSLPFHVQGGYKFLMQNFEPGDRIFLFGFSRGAFCARALAGMLDRVGLLLKGNEESVSLAYRIYRYEVTTKRSDGQSIAVAFKRTFSRPVDIQFIGVFDTVASVGAIWPRSLPFAQGALRVVTFRHAIALDEHRTRFGVQCWLPPFVHKKDGDKDACEDGGGGGGGEGEGAGSKAEEVAQGTPAGLPGPAIKERNLMTDSFYHEKPTDIQEVFFAGGHTDVGGGAGTDDTPPKLSHHPLRWMVREALKNGLILDEQVMKTSHVYAPWAETAAFDALKSGEVPYDKVFPQDVQGRRPSDFLAALVDVASKPPAQVTPENISDLLKSSSFVESPFVQDCLAPQHDRLALKLGDVPALEDEGNGRAVDKNGKRMTKFKWNLMYFKERLSFRISSFFYWVMEVTPGFKATYTPVGSTHSWSLGFNNGRPRQFSVKPVFHSSVLIRQHAEPALMAPGDGLSLPIRAYKPRAQFADNDIIYQN